MTRAVETEMPTGRQAVAKPLGELIAPGARVLLVDDDPDVRDNVQLRLELEGFGVLVAASWREAMEILGQTEPHVILLDLRLDDFDGVEIIRVMKHTLKYPSPIVGYSAYPEYEQEVLDAGGSAFVAKTAPMEELVYTLRLLVEGGFAGN